jgi:UDP-N-acetyl-D-mannosaminuronic acid transferase (WecB/TagA/CpsF family)
MPTDQQFLPPAVIEGVTVTALEHPKHLYQVLLALCQQAREQQSKNSNALPAVVHYLNIHVANQAFRMPRLKTLLQQADLTYCDGAGIVKAAKILGQYLPCRLTMADFIFEMLETFANYGKTVYILAGDAQLPMDALRVIREQVPNHSVVGVASRIY